MNFFKTKTSWSNTEFIVLKLCVASAYVLVGGYFHSFFRQHYVPVLVVFAVTCIWAVYLWVSKMRNVK